MNIAACIILAPLLGWFVPSRRIVWGVLSAVFALLLAPTTHAVLLDDQIDKASMGNTLSYFAVNYVALVVCLAGADWLWRRRHNRSPVGGPTLEPAR
ncbi:MAG: hypothetical protein R2761_06855 [Acidimicrobiales bacterium]